MQSFDADTNADDGDRRADNVDPRALPDDGLGQGPQTEEHDLPLSSAERPAGDNADGERARERKLNTDRDEE